MAYKPGVKTNSDREYVYNGIRLATAFECEQFLDDLKCKWFAVVDTNIARTDEPVNYEWRAGRLWPVALDPEIA